MMAMSRMAVSAFIFADQIWLLMVVIVHTLEYIEAL
jgi:hypothetical protein